MYKLLIADDEKQIRDGLAGLLDWEQYGVDECLFAADGAEALRIAIDKKPSILITDIQMPNMNGLELLEELRKSVPDCRAIVLSGYDDYHLVRSAMKSGALDYLLKPVSKTDIIQIIDEVTANIEEHRKTEKENILFQRSVTIGRYLRQEISPVEFKSKMAVLGFSLPPGPCTAVILVPPHDAESEVFSYDTLSEKIDRHFPQDSGIMSFVDSSERSGFLFFDTESTGADTAPSAIQCVREFLQSEYAAPPALAAGNLSKSYRTAYLSYESAVKSAGEPAEKADSSAADYSGRVKDMISRAESDYSNPDLSLQLLADEYQANSAYIGRMFKKETGISYNDFLKDIRIRRAEELLASGEVKGLQISEMVGFSNYNYFYYVFKKETGINPMEFQHRAAE